MLVHNNWRRADCGAEAAHRGGVWSPGWQAEVAARTADGQRRRPVREGRPHSGLVQRRHGHHVPTCDQRARRTQKVSLNLLRSVPRSARSYSQGCCSHAAYACSNPLVLILFFDRFSSHILIFISFRNTSKRFLPTLS